MVGSGLWFTTRKNLTTVSDLIYQIRNFTVKEYLFGEGKRQRVLDADI